MKRKLLLVVLLVGLLFPASFPAAKMAQAKVLSEIQWSVTERYISRDEIIRRANAWFTHNPPLTYSQNNYHDGYRTDCSGYASYAWGLTYAGNDIPASLGTSHLAGSYATYSITKNELQAGDILLDAISQPANTQQHVVIFERWTNTEHTEYMGYEFTGSGVKYRAIPYPYVRNQQNYQPRRFLYVDSRPVDVLLPSVGHFSDVDVNNPFYGYVEALYSLRTIRGFSDGTYRLNDYATRGMAAKVIIISIGEARQYTDGQTVCGVSSSHTFYPFIRRMLELGFSACPSDGNWKPDDSLSRAGLARFIIGARGENPSYGSCQPPFTDVPCDYLFYKYIRRLKEIFTQKGVGLGYSDGSFHPEEPITRGGLAKYVVVGLDLENHIPRFYDVLFDNTFYPYIEGIAERGLTVGCSSNPPRYCPDGTLTRGGAAKFIIRAIGENPYYNDGVLPFSDVPTNHTFYPFIRRLKELGITSGFSDGTYRPDSNVSRGAMARFIGQALAVRGITCPSNQPQAFSDVPPSHVFYRDIQCLQGLGATRGYSDGTFRPDADITREAAAKFIYVALFQRTSAVPQEATNQANNTCNTNAPSYTAWSRYVVPAGDTDCFRLPVVAAMNADINAQAQIYRIATNDVGLNADIKIEVISSSGSVLASATGSGQSGGTSLMWLPSGTGNYYVRLTNTRNFASEGTYIYVTAERVNVVYLPLVRK